MAQARVASCRLTPGVGVGEVVAAEVSEVDVGAHLGDESVGVGLGGGTQALVSGP